MFTLRCTRKLLKRLGATPSSEAVVPTTVLGDWTANLLSVRPQQLVLAMNERSLLCVVVPASPGSELGLRVRDAVAELLLAIGVPLRRVAEECVAMETMMIGATASRTVLGCMTEATFHLSLRREPGVTHRDLGLMLTENIYSLTKYERPWRWVLGLFGVEPRQMQILRTGRVH